MERHCLLGKTLTGIEIASDKMALRFLTDDGAIIARTDGDCCSRTWIEHIELPALGFPAVVTEVCDLDLPGQEETDDYGNSIQFYGCKITTDRGHIVIDYRNASNGYYGGDLCWPGESGYYGGVYGQNISTEEWRPIDEA